MIVLYVLAVFFVASLALTALFRRYALKKDLIAHPNHRSSHTQPTPYGGGVVFIGLFLIALGVLPVFHLMPTHALKVFGLPIFIIAVLGFCDDVKSLPAKLRFSVQLAAAVIAFYYVKLYYPPFFQGWLMSLGVFGSVLVLLSIVWSTNLYNFMDGIDGISSIEAITIYGGGGVFLWLHGAHQLALLAWILVSSVSGFLVWNWPKAKIFMGDVGSTSLGFLVIIFALISYYKYHISLFVWFNLYLFFTLDATLTLLRRLFYRERLYEAHKRHAFQRLHQIGYTHKQTLFLVMGFNLLFSIFASLIFCYPNYCFLLVLVPVLCYLVFYFWLESKKPMYDRMSRITTQAALPKEKLSN